VREFGDSTEFSNSSFFERLKTRRELTLVEVISGDKEHFGFGDFPMSSSSRANFVSSSRIDSPSFFLRINARALPPTTIARKYVSENLGVGSNNSTNRRIIFVLYRKIF